MTSGTESPNTDDVEPIRTNEETPETLQPTGPYLTWEKIEGYLRVSLVEPSDGRREWIGENLTEHIDFEGPKIRTISSGNGTTQRIALERLFVSATRDQNFYPQYPKYLQALIELILPAMVEAGCVPLNGNLEEIQVAAQGLAGAIATHNVARRTFSKLTRGY